MCGSLSLCISLSIYLLVSVTLSLSPFLYLSSSFPFSPPSLSFSLPVSLSSPLSLSLCQNLDGSLAIMSHWFLSLHLGQTLYHLLPRGLNSSELSCRSDHILKAHKPWTVECNVQPGNLPGTTDSRCVGTDTRGPIKTLQSLWTVLCKRLAVHERLSSGQTALGHSPITFSSFN